MDVFVLFPRVIPTNPHGSSQIAHINRLYFLGGKYMKWEVVRIIIIIAQSRNAGTEPPSKKMMDALRGMKSWPVWSFPDENGLCGKLQTLRQTRPPGKDLRPSGQSSSELPSEAPDAFEKRSDQWTFSMASLIPLSWAEQVEQLRLVTFHSTKLKLYRSLALGSINRTSQQGLLNSFFFHWVNNLGHMKFFQDTRRSRG